MSERELCWECQEKVAKVMKEYRERSVETVSLALSEFAFVTHCHHEPKEKPKCWCEDMTTKGVWRQDEEWRVSVGIVMSQRVKFCLECGRML